MKGKTLRLEQHPSISTLTGWFTKGMLCVQIFLLTNLEGLFSSFF